MRFGSLVLATLLAALTVIGCDEKGPSFFRPAGAGAPDVTPPRFENPRPPPEVEVVAAASFTVEVVDPATSGVAASGVDPGTIEATLLGEGPLPASVDLPTVTVPLVGIEDGPIEVAVAARDFAGNSAVHVFDVVLDRTPPSLDFQSVPGPSVQSNDQVLRVVVRVRVGAEPNFESGAAEVLAPGPDDVCGTADDAAVPSEVLADPTREIPGPGTLTAEFFLDNPVPPDGAARVDAFCWTARASDSARGPEGAPNGNTTTIASRTDVTWMPPPP